jgi:hypothetical protein
MTLTRITSTLGAVALGGLLVASTYGAQAAGPSSAPDHARHGTVTGTPPGPFQAPVAHRYGANSMRLGLHCETTDMS